MKFNSLCTVNVLAKTGGIYKSGKNAVLNALALHPEKHKSKGSRRIFITDLLYTWSPPVSGSGCLSLLQDESIHIISVDMGSASFRTMSGDRYV